MGKRHKGLGMNRPNKKTVQQPEPVAEESGDEDEATVDPEPPEPVPPPPPETEVEAVVARAPEAAPTLHKHMQLARQAITAAQRAVQKKQRRWNKAKVTYITSGNYSHYDHPAVVRRVHQRLQKADVELGQAKAHLVVCQMRWVRLRSFLAWHARMLECECEDPVVARFYERARVRLLEPIEAPEWSAMFLGLAKPRRNIWDVNREQFGLDLTWGLMHISQL